jgi:tetratricopeptide (TPR) repeat protein
MNKHPRPEVLAGLYESLSVEHTGLFLHLLQCPECAHDAMRRLSPPALRRGVLALRRDAGEVDYQAIFSRLEETNRDAFATIQRGREAAQPLLAELLSHPCKDRERLVRNDPRWRSSALANLLLEEGRRRSDARGALAGLALAIAERLDPDLGPHVEDLKAAAHCEVAEGLRAQGDLGGAESAFDRANQHLRSSEDTVERATYCHLLAALRRDQGHVEEALALLDRASDLFEDHGNFQAKAAALVEYGFLSLEVNDPERSLAAFDQVMELGPRALPPDLALQAVQGLALSLALVEEVEEALATLTHTREAYQWPQNSRENLTLLCLEGRISLGCQRLEAAKSLLTTAFHGFLQLGEAYQSFIAGLSLARAIFPKGRKAGTEIKRIALQLLPLLDSPKLSNAVRSALEPVLADIIKKASASGKTLRELSDYLDHARTRPTLQFGEFTRGTGRRPNSGL